MTAMTPRARSSTSPSTSVPPPSPSPATPTGRRSRPLGPRPRPARAPQSTGHNAGPLGSLEQTVLIRTSGLGGVEIDPVGETCRAGAGVLWEEVVDAAAPHGLIALHGSSPTVGITGYSLGGGMGWLARSHGLQTNSVTAVELVTADGELIRTDADHDPELFWALRGGGGNFGIVTALEFKLYPLTEIYAGFMLWDWTEAERVLTGWAAWAADAPDGVTTSLRIMQLPPDPALPPLLSGRQIVLIDGAAQGSSLIEPLRALSPELDTFATVPAPSLVRLHQDPRSRCPTRRPARSSSRCRPRRSRRSSRAPARFGLAAAGRRAAPGGGALGRIAPGRERSRASTASSSCSCAGSRPSPRWVRPWTPTWRSSRRRSSP